MHLSILKSPKLHLIHANKAVYFKVRNLFFIYIFLLCIFYSLERATVGAFCFYCLDLFAFLFERQSDAEGRKDSKRGSLLTHQNSQGCMWQEPDTSNTSQVRQVDCSNLRTLTSLFPDMHSQGVE